MKEKQIVIGIRGEAKQGRSAAIMMIVALSIFLLFFLFFGVIMIRTGAPIIAPIIFMSVTTSLCVFGIIFGIINLKWANANDSIMNKPVLLYDEANDTFIGYDCRHDNAEIVIKNGDIKGIRGSAMFTARELFITYEINGKLKKSSFGFCRNIDNGVFRYELNKYHNPKL